MEEKIYISEDAENIIYDDQLDKALKVFSHQLRRGTKVTRVNRIIDGASYIIMPYDQYCSLEEKPERTTHCRYYLLFEDDSHYLQKLSELNPTKEYRWEWKNRDGYEVTSRGDRRFSPFFMILDDGTSIEDFYQTEVKGGVGKGTPCNDMESAHARLRNLMNNYIFTHYGLFYELALIGITKSFTDMFDKLGGQNKIYADCLNDYFRISERL